MLFRSFASMQIYFVLVVMPFLIFTPRPERLPELMAFYLGSMMIAVLMSFPVALMTFMEKVFANPNQARSAVLLLIVLTELNDIFQFICGKLFGRRKIIPKISPNKTEAGFIGGALLSSLASALIWPNVIPISTELAALLGLILSLAGMLGDLVCSAIKRFRGVKDFSDLIPGHGGILDRIDSLLATGPAFFYFLYFTIGRNG